MNNFKQFIFIITGLLGLVMLVVFLFSDKKDMSTPTNSSSKSPAEEEQGGLQTTDNPYAIEYLRKQDYPGSDIVIEQTLTPDTNYSKYIASYKSEGLKIYALLTIPNSEKPKNGFPVVIFNHGYIPPAEYRTNEKYEAYIDAFARNGYIVFKSDYRGHGNSEGNAGGGHISPAYTIDILNALSSLKKYPEVNPQKIGMWGHSMGGGAMLRAMVISKDIKAGSIWAGTVGPLNNEFSGRKRPNHVHPSGIPNHNQRLNQQFGARVQNPEFWKAIDPLNYLQDITSPIELQHGTDDQEVDPRLSAELYNKLKALGKKVDYYTYEGDNHNISVNLELALDRSVAFFNKYLKGGE